MNIIIFIFITGDNKFYIVVIIIIIIIIIIFAILNVHQQKSNVYAPRSHIRVEKRNFSHVFKIHKNRFRFLK